MDNSGELYTCLNCGNSFTGKYCNQCAEKVFDPHAKSFKHIAEETLHFLTHFEGSFFTSLKTIFTRPGQMSLDYCNGKRKSYYKPTSLFLLVVIIYLLFPVFKGLDLPLEAYQTSRVSYFGEAITAKLGQKHISHQQLAERFAHESHVISKFVLLLILPMCCLALAVLHPRRKVFYDHFILSVEINTFFITATFLLLPILTIIPSLLIPSLGAYIAHDDFFISIATLALGLFIYAAFKRFYRSHALVSILTTTVFLICQYFIVFFAYRTILFSVVMWLI